MCGTFMQHCKYPSHFCETFMQRCKYVSHFCETFIPKKEDLPHGKPSSCINI